MATSASTNYSIDRDGLITKSLQLLGVVEEGGTASANQLTDGSNWLNMLTKFWVTKGLQLWAQEEIVLFPVKTQQVYKLGGASLDKACLSTELVKTELSAAVTANDTTITVDSVTGMTNGDVLGVQTDEGGIIWTTISDASLDVSIDLAAGITSAAAINNNVYTYTNRPLRIRTAWVSNDSDVDIPIEVIPHKDYISLSNKATEGQVNQIYADPQLNEMLINVWPIPGDDHTDQLIHMYVHRTFEDFDASTDTPDFPQEWYMPLVFNLAMYMAPVYGCPRDKLAAIGALSKQLLDEVTDWDTEYQSIQFIPDSQNRIPGR